MRRRESRRDRHLGAGCARPLEHGGLPANDRVDPDADARAETTVDACHHQTRTDVTRPAHRNADSGASAEAPERAVSECVVPALTEHQDVRFAKLTELLAD